MGAKIRAKRTFLRRYIKRSDLVADFKYCRD